MSESISGSLHVSNDVLADIVGHQAMECYGIVGMCPPESADGISKLLPDKTSRKGVVISADEQGVRVDMYVVIEYGTNMNSVAQNLINSVKFALSSYAGVEVSGVEVHVQGVKIRK